MKRSFRMAFVALMFFTVATLAAVSPAVSYDSWRSWMIASPSMADAKKHGDFLCSIKPVPDNFSWEGHFVEVYECWALLQILPGKFQTSYETCFSVRFSDYAASNSSMSDFQNSP